VVIVVTVVVCVVVVCVWGGGGKGGGYAYRHNGLPTAKFGDSNVRRGVGVRDGGEGPFEQEVGRLDVPITNALLVALLQHTQGSMQHLYE